MIRQKNTLWRMLSVLLVIFLLCAGSKNARAEVKPWAKYTAEDKTLTFYYGEKNSLDDKEYWLISDDSKNPGWSEVREEMEHVRFDPSFADARPTNCHDWFAVSSIRDITGLEYLNTSKVTSMWRMFADSQKLTEIDLSHFDTSNVTNMGFMFAYCQGLQSLDLRSFDTRNVTNMQNMFSTCVNLTSLDLSSFDTSKVGEMSSMFYKCSKLATLDLSNFDTSNVKNMGYMFARCSELTTLDLRNFDTSKVTDMRNMFTGCSKLETVVTNFSAENLKIAGWMFQYCSKLKYLYVSESFVNRINTIAANMRFAMFDGCTSLPNYESSDFQVTNNAKFIPGGFLCNIADYGVNLAVANYDDNAKSLNFSYDSKVDMIINGDTYTALVNEGEGEQKWPDNVRKNTQKVVFGSSFADYRPKNCAGLLSGFSALTTIEGLENLNTTDATSMANMFKRCVGIQALVLSNFSTANAKSLDGMFSGCSKLRSIYANDDFAVSSGCTSEEMFYGCAKLPNYEEQDIDGKKACYVSKGGYLYRIADYIRPWVHKADGTLTFYYGLKVDEEMESGKDFLLNDEYHAPEWIGKRGTSCSDVTTVVFDKSFAQARPTNCFEWFYNFTSLTTIEGLENLNTSEVTKMASMFVICTSLETLDLSMLDTRNVTDMSHMFVSCTSLKTLNISKLNTENVTDMSGMFYNCSSLASLDLSHFNTEKVKRLTGMFEKCPSLTSLDLTQFDIHNVESMVWMFHYCPLLKSVYISDKFVAKEGVECDNPFKGSPACFNCLPSQYDAVKGNVFADYIKPYVSINANAPYGTLCVPIGGTLADGSFSGFDKLYRVQGANANTGEITLEEAKSIEPGVAYVYRRNLPEDTTESIITFTADNDVASVSEPKNEGNLLKGTFQSINAPEGSYILLTDGNFHPVATGNANPVGAYRAYLDLGQAESGSASTAAQTYRMVFVDDEVTGIGHIDTDNIGQADQQPKAVYDLTGRRVTSPQKGNVYIVNGKKMMYDK